MEKNAKSKYVTFNIKIIVLIFMKTLKICRQYIFSIFLMVISLIETKNEKNKKSDF